MDGISAMLSTFSLTKNSAQFKFGGQGSDGSPHDQTSRVEVLKYAYYLRFLHSHKVINLLANPMESLPKGTMKVSRNTVAIFHGNGVPISML